MIGIKVGGNILESTQKRKLINAAAIVMSSMVISRITGFLRSMLITNKLVTADSDALFAAFRTTDIMYNLLVGGAIAAALIPVLSGYLATDREEEGWNAVSTFFNVIFISMLGLSILGVIFAPNIVNVTAPGLNMGTKIVAIHLTRILFPSVSFIMLAGLTNGVLNSYQRFAAAAYGPSVYNIGTVLSILFLSKYGVAKVTFGIMCSAGVYFLFQLSFAFKNLKYYRFKLLLKHEGFIRLFKLAIPSLIASSITQVNIIISQRYTSKYSLGSITAYYNANDTWQLPYGIFAMGLGTALLPTMSEKLALGDISEFKSILNKGIKSILLLTIPSGVAFIVLRVPVISAIYKWTANFNSARITQASDILTFFSIALLAQSILAIIGRAFYADNDTKTPLYVGLGSTIMNGVLCYIFYNTTSLQAAGMSLAYSLSSTFNAVVLIIILDRKMKGIHLEELFAYIFKVLAASAAMGVVLFVMNKSIPVDFKEAFSLHKKIIELFYLFVEILVGLSTYFAAALLIKVDEAIYLFKAVAGKARRLAQR